MVNKFVTTTAFAKQRGITRAAVLIAIKKGIITATKTHEGSKSPWMIDLEAANAQWNAAVNMEFSKEKQQVGLKKTGEPTQRKESPPHVEQKKALNYYESRAIRELYQARLAKLEFEQRTEKLVEVEDVRRTAYDIAAKIRQGLLNIPVKVASTYAAQTDPHKIEDSLNKEMREVLGEMADELGKKLH